MPLGAASILAIGTYFACDRFSEEMPQRFTYPKCHDSELERLTFREYNIVQDRVAQFDSETFLGRKIDDPNMLNLFVAYNLTSPSDDIGTLTGKDDVDDFLRSGKYEAFELYKMHNGERRVSSFAQISLKKGITYVLLNLTEFGEFTTMLPYQILCYQEWEHGLLGRIWNDVHLLIKLGEELDKPNRQNLNLRDQNQRKS